MDMYSKLKLQKRLSSNVQALNALEKARENNRVTDAISSINLSIEYLKEAVRLDTISLDQVKGE